MFNSARRRHFHSTLRFYVKITRLSNRDEVAHESLRCLAKVTVIVKVTPPLEMLSASRREREP